jgi:hypothetical protein
MSQDEKSTSGEPLHAELSQGSQMTMTNLAMARAEAAKAQAQTKSDSTDKKW